MFESLARAVGGVLAAVLPARLWADLEDHVPVARCAMFSALATTVAGMILAVNVILERYPAVSVLFLVKTAHGWLSIYLITSGVVRLGAAVAEEPLGDLILTGVDAALLRERHDRRAAVDRAQRAALEGPEVPDLLAPGAEAGISGAELVVIASRKKADWRVGTVVVMGKDEEWYSIAHIEERTIDRRLRTLYALVRHRDTDVARHVVRYRP